MPHFDEGFRARGTWPHEMVETVRTSAPLLFLSLLLAFCFARADGYLVERIKRFGSRLISTSPSSDRHLRLISYLFFQFLDILLSVFPSRLPPSPLPPLPLGHAIFEKKDEKHVHDSRGRGSNLPRLSRILILCNFARVNIYHKNIRSSGIHIGGALFHETRLFLHNRRKAPPRFLCRWSCARKYFSPRRRSVCRSLCSVSPAECVNLRIKRHVNRSLRHRDAEFAVRMFVRDPLFAARS